MKKYKGGFSERLQKRSGGRIKAVVGGPQELKNITNYTPMPITTTEAKLIPGQPTSIRRGAEPLPPEGKLKQVDLDKITPNLNNLNPNKLLTEKELKALNASKPISKAQKELNEMNTAQQKALELAQTGQQLHSKEVLEWKEKQ
jgi:hypothetical protein